LRRRLNFLLDLLECPNWFSLVMEEDESKFDFDAARQMIEARITELGLSRDLIHAHITRRDVKAEVGQAWHRLPFSERMNSFRREKL
jgi:hypothetical protein